MPLAYYSRAASQDFWDEHWAGHEVSALVDIARRSPLTSIIEAALPPAGRILEAGCGLGPYVVLLRQRGRAIAGADWSLDALSRCRAAAPGTPLAAMDLRALSIQTAALDACLSGGPDAIVAEAARVLRPGGRLLLSVPYVNGMRRLLAPHLVRQARRMRATGAAFYQYAFSRREIRRFLEANGFRVVSFHPYDPLRLPRQALRRLIGGARRSPARAASPSPARHVSSSAAASGGRELALRRAIRRVAYSGLSLRIFAHMILAVAVRR